VASERCSDLWPRFTSFRSQIQVTTCNAPSLTCRCHPVAPVRLPHWVGCCVLGFCPPPRIISYKLATDLGSKARTTWTPPQDDVRIKKMTPFEGSFGFMDPRSGSKFRYYFYQTLPPVYLVWSLTIPGRVLYLGFGLETCYIAMRSGNEDVSIWLSSKLFQSNVSRFPECHTGLTSSHLPEIQPLRPSMVILERQEGVKCTSPQDIKFDCQLLTQWLDWTITWRIRDIHLYLHLKAMDRNRLVLGNSCCWSRSRCFCCQRSDCCCACVCMKTFLLFLVLVV